MVVSEEVRHQRAPARLCLWETPYKHVVRHAVTDENTPHIRTSESVRSVEYGNKKI